jgi:hypothetical protein
MDSLIPKSKVCNKCGEEKLLEEFNKHKNKKYGRQDRCKACRRQDQQENKEKIAEYSKQYYETNKEKLAEYRKQYYQANKEKIAERSKIQKRQYRKANKEKIKQYREENKEKIAEYRKQYRKDNREKIYEWIKNRYKNDEQFRIRNKLSRLLRIALNKTGKTKNASTLTYIGCSIEFMKEHLNSTKKPNWGDDLHIDHIIPCASFDHTNEEEIKKCWNWRNLRYLPAEENKSKKDKLDMDLVKSYGIEDLLPVGVDK